MDLKTARAAGDFFSATRPRYTETLLEVHCASPHERASGEAQEGRAQRGSHMVLSKHGPDSPRETVPIGTMVRISDGVFLSRCWPSKVSRCLPSKGYSARLIWFSSTPNRSASPAATSTQQYLLSGYLASMYYTPS